MTSKRGPIAFFDFDGTLTQRDSLMPFLNMIRGNSLFLLDLIYTSPWLVAYVAGVLNNQKAKEVLLHRALGNMNYQELCEYGECFAKNHIPTMLNTTVMNQLQVHQEKGHHCVLVSASLDLYLNPWAKAMGFDHCISSSLEIDEKGGITGRLKDRNCFGQEKVRRIKQYLAGSELHKKSYAYGNSKGDLPMLSYVKNGIMVDRDFTLNRF